MPEWMDDNNDGDNQLSTATFEKDGTFTELSSLRQNSNEQQKVQTQSSTDETPSRGNIVSYKKFLQVFFFYSPFYFKIPSKQQETNKPEKSTSLQTDKAVVNVPTVSETIGRFLLSLS
jgi:hypothetical protein